MDGGSKKAGEFRSKATWPTHDNRNADEMREIARITCHGSNSVPKMAIKCAK